MISTRKSSNSKHNTASTYTNDNLYWKLYNKRATSTYTNTGQHFGIVSKVSDRIQINKISKFFKSSVVWILGFVLTIFVRRFIIRRNTNKFSRPD